MTSVPSTSAAAARPRVTAATVTVRLLTMRPTASLTGLPKQTNSVRGAASSIFGYREKLIEEIDAAEMLIYIVGYLVIEIVKFRIG